MKIKKIYALTLSAVLCFAALFGAMPKNVNAASLSTSISGSSSLEAGGSITLTFNFSSSDNIAAIMGSLSYDTDKLSVASVSASGYFSVTLGSSLVADSDGASASTGGSFARVTFTAKSAFKEGESTTITLSSVSATAIDSSGMPSTISGSGSSKTISIPKKTITPQTPSGGSSSTATPKSSDNKLKSLTLSEGTLSPEFSATVAAYTVSIGFETQSVAVNATANSSKARVSIDIPEVLEPGEVSVITVTVTAENGSKRTYTIDLTRAQDPNYIPSTDTSLTELIPSYGALSPSFSPDVLFYAIDVPYECEEINFTAKTSFKKAIYAVLGNPGLSTEEDNIFTVLVTAEDRVSVRRYTITVHRASGYDAERNTAKADEIVRHIVSEEYTVWNLSASPVAIIEPEVFRTLKKYPEHTLKIVTRNGSYTINGADITGNIGNVALDITLNASSIYENGMTGTLASYQNSVFSLHYKNELPGTMSYCVYTNIKPGTIVNIYKYDDAENSFYTVATNIVVSPGGVLEFVWNTGGDFLATDKTIEEALNALLPEENDNPDPVKVSYMKYYIAAAVLGALLIGLLIGLAAGRKRTKKTVNKDRQKTGNNKNVKKQKKKLSDSTNGSSKPEKASASADGSALKPTASETEAAEATKPDNNETVIISEEDTQPENDLSAPPDGEGLTVIDKIMNERQYNGEVFDDDEIEKDNEDD